MAEKLSLLGDEQLIKKVEETHSPGTDKAIDMKPILLIVKDIIRHTIVHAHDNTTLRAETSSQDFDALQSPINYASYMFTWKCVGGVDEDSVTMELLESVLSKYSWDAKAVISFAAFAINYGEFWLLRNPGNSQSAQDMATLMGFRKNLEIETWGAAMNLLNLLMNLTSYIIYLKEVPPEYRNEEQQIHLSVYWIISSLVFCASLFADMFCNNYKSYSVDEAKGKISGLRSKLSPVMQDLWNKVQSYWKKIEYDKTLIEFKERVINRPHMDNLEVLDAFFCPRNGERQLYNGSRTTKETIDVLRQKYVLLLITRLGFSSMMLKALRSLYNDSSLGSRDYEIVWLPILDQYSKLQETKFENLRNNMPWFSVEHPSDIEPVFIRFIQEELHFTDTPILVVFDPQGKLVHSNALPMVWIWGATTAFPFTTERETSLWHESRWNIQLILDNIHPSVGEWVKTNKVICLYGGDDVDWVRKFTQSARTAAQALNAPLEMLYVGKQRSEEKDRICHEAIAKDNLSHIIVTDDIWYFWVRLASMWNSKKQIGKTVEDDHIMQGAQNLLMYNNSVEQGWAVFGRGDNEITMANGDKMVSVLDSYATWSNEVDQPDKFVQVLDEHLQSHYQPRHCNRLIFPGQGAYPETVVCEDCGQMMEKYIMYRCCID